MSDKVPQIPYVPTQFIYVKGKPDSTAYHILDPQGQAPEASRFALCHAAPFLQYGHVWYETINYAPDDTGEICPVCLKRAKAIDERRFQETLRG